MELIVTLDHFFQDWDSGRGTLWLCVQPHVQTAGSATAVRDWIQQSADGSGLTYRAAALSATKGLELTPVPFTDNCSVEIRLLDAAGNPVPTPDPNTGALRPSIINDLANAFNITDAVAFEKANRDEESPQTSTDPDGAGRDGEIPPQPVYELPFARGYNQTLRDAMAPVIRQRPRDGSAPTAPSEGEMRDMLCLAFWGGVRRVLPAGVVTATDLADWMQVDQEFDGSPVANQHGLCGLLFRLGGPGELAALSGVRQIEITISANGWTKQVQDMASPASLASIEAFFSGLSGFQKADPALRPTLIWDPEFARRVYAIDDGAGFVHSRPGTEDWYIRPASRTRSRQERLRRLFVIQAHDTTERLPDQLQLTLYMSFRVQLHPYRSYPKRSGAPGLWELVASPDDALRLASFLKAHAGILSRGRFFDENGVAVASSPELVGAYDLPWDGARRSSVRLTVVYWGDEAANAVILRLPVPDAGGAPRTLDADFVLPGGKPNPFGPRWEVDLEAVADVLDDFDALACVAAPANTVAALSALVVSAVWPGEVAFEFAQAVSSIEGNIDANYVYPPEPHAPDAVTPLGEYTSDLVNFNALNVFFGWNEGANKLKSIAHVDHLNKFSELYPVKQTLGANRLLHHFVFRSRPPASVPPKGAAAETFYSGLYTAIPEGRRLGFNLEHTYGTRFDGDVEPLASGHLDFPLLPASRISRPAADSNASPKAVPSHQPFLRCRFEENTGGEVLTLTFETAWLDAVYADDPVWGPVYVQAWRSVAELAFAQSIDLTALCLVFDFTRGLQAGGTNLLSALRPDDLIQIFPIDCSGRLQGIAQAFLGGDFTKKSERIMLTYGSQPRIARRCHVVEFGLAVERTGDRLPNPPMSTTSPAPWQLLRFRTNLDIDHLYGPKGQATASVTGGADILAFSMWMTSLRSAAASIEHENDPSVPDRTRLLRRLLSGARDEDAHQWIAPAGAVAGDGRKTWLSACPIGFRPLAIEQQVLQARTTLLLARYMQALAAMLDCRSSVWAANWTTAAQWRSHFSALQQRASSVVAIVQRAVDLLLPLPDPDPGSGVDTVVQKSVAAWTTPSTGVKDAIVAWSRAALLRDPSLFATAKALMYTRMWGGEDGHALSSDFFEFRSDKQIRAQEIDGAGNVVPAIVVHDTFTYREGLGSLAGSPWFGFAELLDDLRYDSEFEFADLQLTNFESFVTRAMANEDGIPPPAVQPMPIGEKHVPGPKKGEVPLAARSPISPPAPQFSGEIATMANDDWVNGLSVGQQFDRQAFLSGDLVRASTGASDVVELVGRSLTLPGRRDAFRDDFVLSTIVAVRGDEEANQDWTSGWKRDRFYLDVVVAPAVMSMAVPLPTSTSVHSYFDRLASSPDPRVMTGLEAGYDPEILSFVHGAMIPAAVQTFNGTGRWFAEMSVDKPGETVSVAVRMHDTGNPPGVGDPLIEVFAFRSSDPLGPVGDQPHLYLIVNWLCKNWVPQRLAVEQTRNIAQGFAPEFASTATSIGSAYQPFVDDDLYLHPAIVRLTRRKYGLEELAKLLLLPGMLEDVDEAAKHDLSLTVSHDQIMQVVGEYLDASGKVVSVTKEPIRSALPLSHVIHAGGTWSGAEVDLTSFAYPNAVVDFQWSSKSNLQFFRLHSRRAILV